MRNTFAKVLEEEAISREKIVLLSGDIGNRMFDNFKRIAPNRFINCGIAEANMMSMASGLAISGFQPIVYTITPFTTTRCFEQIRVGVAYHEAPVIIIGTGSGLSYAELGPTHHSLEDIAIMRTLPGMRILAPADSLELRAQLVEALDNKSPTYIRIGKKGEPDLHDQNSNLGISKSNILKKGKDGILFGIGPILYEAIKAHEILKRRGIEITIVNMGTVKPINEKILENSLKKNFDNWFTLEEHSTIGGLGSSIGEWLLTQSKRNLPRFVKFGVPDRFLHKLGNQIYVREQLCLDSENIAKRIASFL